MSEKMKGMTSDNSLPEGKTITGAGVTHGKIEKETLQISLKPPERKETPDSALWVAIRNRVNKISFERYKEVIDNIFNNKNNKEKEEEEEEKNSKNKSISNKETNKKGPDIRGMSAYNILKSATETFLLLNAGLDFNNDNQKNGNNERIIEDSDEESIRLGKKIDEETIKDNLKTYLRDYKTLPYIDKIVKNLIGGEYSKSPIEEKMLYPQMIELIWSYWHEEGLLVQTINAISLRFQNIRSRKNDPLAQLEIDPLRPLNNLLWGYIQDENNRLSILRRAYEYDHQYGITLYGKAIPKLYSADSRSRFIEAFHNLLYRAAIFYKEDADTTIVSDGFPLLNLLKELHLILTEGQHNQFGDLAWTARAEMLIQQWILSREEIREFLRRRPMVPYEESWMGVVDTMKKLQGWNDVSVTHFHELAVCGEKILLSVRYGNWSMERDQERAKNWARYWKQEIQSYIHSYRIVTGVDLTLEPVDVTPPSIYLKREEERKKKNLLIV